MNVTSLDDDGGCKQGAERQELELKVSNDIHTIPKAEFQVENEIKASKILTEL